ncbi:MAG: thiamine pyrophosphate-dependent dehydrogenase E1 component subunit alpha [Acidobacteria bacterium]|nr:thiamine pyrophosphate-dependent dehydrogenase E1 component subunit alpha [Acidobacteriota bacterium]MCB9397524.1 thiamine pyrophosphate-dependent dehydrogenase E1 component subunit alpha [Acidobacteriota bacterium]
MDKALKLKILDLMITSRCMEERLIKMSKSADGFFWLGGPGEEAFNIPLGLLARPGQGLDYDYFHFHYRNGATMLAMGMDPKDEIRQMNNRATDPFSGGRNFCNHYARYEWNVVPVTSTIQTQWLVAPGTARAQKRHGGDGITIVTCGDAGTAEGDFHIGLNWATQPGHESPVLFIITNNQYGISTPYEQVHGTRTLASMGAGYGMEYGEVDGTDVEASYAKLQEVMAYVRKERKPFLLEAHVTRLYGHSSSSGANRVPEGSEQDPIETWLKKLIKQKLITREAYEEKFKAEVQRMNQLLAEVKQEPEPTGDSIYQHIFKEV